MGFDTGLALCGWAKQASFHSASTRRLRTDSHHAGSARRIESETPEVAVHHTKYSKAFFNWTRVDRFFLAIYRLLVFTRGHADLHYWQCCHYLNATGTKN